MLKVLRGCNWFTSGPPSSSVTSGCKHHTSRASSFDKFVPNCVPVVQNHQKHQSSCKTGLREQGNGHCAYFNSPRKWGWFCFQGSSLGKWLAPSTAAFFNPSGNDAQHRCWMMCLQRGDRHSPSGLDSELNGLSLRFLHFGGKAAASSHKRFGFRLGSYKKVEGLQKSPNLLRETPFVAIVGLDIKHNNVRFHKTLSRLGFSARGYILSSHTESPETDRLIFQNKCS